MAFPSKSDRLPQEVLLTIFKLVEPSPYLHTPSITRGPRNPWLVSIRTKKALVLVCKAWAAPATELLYSDIVLRRMGQISALAQTFRTDRNKTLSNLLRSICLHMCVVLTHCAHTVRQDFEYILGQSTMLLSFTVNPHPHAAFDDEPLPGQIPPEPAAFNPTWFLDLDHGRAGSLLARLLTSRLSTLSLTLTTHAENFPHLSQILASAPHLTSLDLGPVLAMFDPDSWPTLPDLSFPALKSLSIFCDSFSFVQYVTTGWSMPRLDYLYCKEDVPMPLLSAHGKQLTYLHCIYSDASLPYLSAHADLLPRLHELCPRISHLVIRLSPSDRAALDIRSPTLRYLDLVARPSVAAYRAIALAPPTHAPRLAKIRMVMAPCDSIPRRFHPSHMPGSDRALEDLSDIPGAGESESDDRADWLMLTTGGIEGWCPEGLMRQHAWAVVLDERCEGTLHPGARGDPRIPADDETEADSEGEYEYPGSLPTSPVASESDSEGSDREGGGGASDGDDDCEPEMAGAHSEEGSDVDSDMEREWFEVEPEMAPYPNKVAFVDDALDSSRGQYDRETMLERFSQSQLGDFLLE